MLRNSFILISSLFVSAALVSPLKAQENQPSAVDYNFSDFRESPDQHGVGFGISSLASQGLFLFYDYNLHHKSKQLHLQLDAGYDTRETLLGREVARISLSDLMLTFRHVTPRGWFIGVGAGLYNTVMNISQDGDSERVGQDLEFWQKGYMLAIDAGWQGNEYYYFHIGARLSTLTKTSEYYEPELIYDISNHRSESASMWKLGNNYGSLSLGFGWYIEPFDHDRPKNSTTTRSTTTPQKPSEELINKAKKCQEKGGLWINDSCQISLE
jgi:hypothetical protein